MLLYAHNWKKWDFLTINRKAPNKDGLLLSDSGNILVDVEIETYQDPYSLYHSLKSIVGVIEVSLFVKEVTDIVYMDNGKNRT